MKLENLIPKDKHDINAIKNLDHYSYNEIKPICINLLEWIQDINWPVAKKYLEKI